MPASPIIQGMVVNHNTSPYTELMLRSLFATHPALPGLTIRVLDNGSTDDMAGLRAFAKQAGIPVIPSGYPLNTANNSHGDVMRAFVLANPDCDYYLFLDTDVVFVQPGTIPGMLQELAATNDAFGAGPTLSWDGAHPLPEAGPANPDVCLTRLHPCCALVKNTPVFRAVVEEIGLCCAKLLRAEHEEYWDTFRLMTRVMKTHGQRHVITSQMVIHFFCTSYVCDPEPLKKAKIARRDALLAEYRAGHEATH